MINPDALKNARKGLKTSPVSGNSKEGKSGPKRPPTPTSTLIVGVSGLALSFSLLAYKFPNLRNSYGAISSVACISLFALSTWRPRTPLMELASAINDDEIPEELEQRIKRINHNKAIAKSPPTPAEELSKLDITPSPRFCVDDPELLNYLDKHGYVVVNLQVEQSKLQQLEDCLWNFIESNFCGWKRYLPDTWNVSDEDRGAWLPSKGIIFGAGIGHSEFLWKVRMLKGMKEAFAKVWNDDNLITSFDGANIFRPWNTNEAGGVDRKDRRTNGGWWHVDQGKNKAGKRHAVQGLFSLYKADETTGGLCVMPQSQHRHDEVVQDSLSSQDYVTVQPYLPGFADMERRLICCEAGDLILWDSRTIHCNTPAPKPDANGCHNPQELLRAVAYVCMTPHKFATSEVLELRKQAYNHRITTSHWPHIYHPGNPLDEDKMAQQTHVAKDYDSCDTQIKALIA